MKQFLTEVRRGLMVKGSKRMDAFESWGYTG